MRKTVAKRIGRAARAAGKHLGKNKSTVGLAAAGAAVVVGAVVLAKNRRARRARNDGTGASAEEPDARSAEIGDSAEAAMHIPVVADADATTRSRSRKGRMTEAPVAGARFNDVREDRKDTRTE